MSCYIIICFWDWVLILIQGLLPSEQLYRDREREMVQELKVSVFEKERGREREIEREGGRETERHFFRPNTAKHFCYTTMEL